MISKRITTLKELNKLALHKKTVVCPGTVAWSEPKPAAFMINLQGRMLLELFNRGMFLYKPNEK